NHTLGIYLDKDQMGGLKSDEDFLMSAIDNATIRNKGLRQAFDRVLRTAEKQGKLPLGPFKNIVREKLGSESEEIAGNLEQLGVHPSQICKIEFSDHYQEPRKTEKGNWHLPPLEIKYKDEIPIKIVGKIREAAPEGLIVVANDNQADALKN